MVERNLFLSYFDAIIEVVTNPIGYSVKINIAGTAIGNADSSAYNGCNVSVFTLSQNLVGLRRHRCASGDFNHTLIRVSRKTQVTVCNEFAPRTGNFDRVIAGCLKRSVHSQCAVIRN